MKDDARGDLPHTWRITRTRRIPSARSLTNTGVNAKAGVMIRESPAAKACESGVWVTPGGGIQFTRRTSTGGSTGTLATVVLTNSRALP